MNEVQKGKERQRKRKQHRRKINIRKKVDYMKMNERQTD